MKRILLLTLSFPLLLPLQAQNIEAIAQREIARRQASITEARELIEKGDELMEQRDYLEAVKEYKAAYDMLPDSVVAEKIRRAALERFSAAAIKLAEQRIQEGRYEDAEIVAKMVIKEGYNPEYRPAIRLLARLEDPQYYNQTITPAYIEKVEEVKRLLNEGEGYYMTGRFDLAYKRGDQVLNIDPYNIAARRLHEKIEKARTEYAEEAYNHTRGHRIWELTQAWETPVRQYGEGPERIIEQPEMTKGRAEEIRQKVNNIIIPRIEFREATIREAIDFLKMKSEELDPEGEGVNIVLRLDGGAGRAQVPSDAEAEGETASAAPARVSSAGDVRVNLSLNEIPLIEALRYVADQARLKVKIEPYAVAVVPLSAPEGDLYTKEYRVPPDFIQSQPGGGQDTDGGGGFGGPMSPGMQAGGGGSEIAERGTALQTLKARGVEFPPGATAYYLPSTSKLIVRNTQENLDLIDLLVDEATVIPKQVEIEAKFIEITQNNLKELSFDWLLGQFNAPGSDDVFASGGTTGFAPDLNNADFPFVAPGAGAPVGTFPVTAANRSGSLAVTANAIDALLFPFEGSTSIAPGVFSLAGVFTDPQFQVVIRALDRKKGVDLLSAPKVTTKSGARAIIEIVREFRYPVEFDPPEIPQEFGSLGDGGGATGASAPAFPVTPTTPTAFETRNTGVTLEVEPVVGPDGYTIDLTLVPQVVEFEGFVNYGSPIQTVAISTVGGPTGLAQPQSVTLTDNEILQPVFSMRKVTTSVSIWDGQTVALGGLMREDIQKVDDKVPLLGDLPIIGRAFRSTVDQHLKRNLIIFVTARLIDPAGQPIIGRDLEEEAVEPTITEDTFTRTEEELPYFPK